METWHAYAKLRMHTAYTIASLRSQTKELGRQLRCYANKLCPQYRTKKLPGEAAAQYRRKAAKAKKATFTPKKPAPPKAKSKPSQESDLKKFNLETYKIHALGDYADHIERFGPTDCFTTQQVCFSPLVTYSFSHAKRVNLSTGESKGTTSEQTRPVLSARLRNASGWNIITVSMSTPYGGKLAARRCLNIRPQTLLRALRHNNTTLSHTRTGLIWIFTHYPLSA